MRVPRFKIEGVERVREGTHKVYLDAGKEGKLRVVVYPSPLPMLVLGAEGVQWLASDLTEAQRTQILAAVKGQS